jgi:hypothetical protein
MPQPLETKVRRRAAWIGLGTAFTLAFVAEVAFALSGGVAPVVQVRGFDARFIVTEVHALPGAPDAPGAAPAVAGRAPRVIVVQDGEMLDAPANAVAAAKMVSKTAPSSSSRLRAKRLAESRQADSAVRVTVVGPDGKVETRTLRIRR